jgi:AraC family transcriptional activator FtrA
MPDNRKNMTISLPPEHQHLVVALAYDGLCTFEFGVAVEIFGLPRPNWARTGIALPLRRWMKGSCVRPAVSAL